MHDSSLASIQSILFTNRTVQESQSTSNCNMNKALTGNIHVCTYIKYNYLLCYSVLATRLKETVSR